MRRKTRPAAGHPRGGFTLVELLVAAALSLVVMTVLSLAFQTGLQTLSNLKSVVGLAEQMRAAEGVIRRDLTATHLANALDQPVLVSQLAGGERGYFRFTQGESLAVAPEGPGPHQEGLPENGLASFRTPSARTTAITAPANVLSGRAWGDYLAFTARLKGDGPQEIFTASLGSTPAVAQANLAALTTAGVTRPELQAADPTGTLYVSRWAEVAYFLVPSNTRGGETVKVLSSDEGMPPGSLQLPLYTLYRRQRALVPQTPNPAITLAGSLPGLATSAANPVGIEAIAAAANWIGGTNDPIAQLATNPPAAPAAQTPQLLALTTPPIPAAAVADQQSRPHPIPNLRASVTDPGTTLEFGSDVLLNNVVSMTVRPVLSHRVPQQLIDFARANNIANPVFTSPDGLIGNAAGEFADYSPRNMLFPDVAPTGPNAYTSTTQYPRFFATGGGGFNGTFLVNGNPQVAPITGFRLKAIEIKLRVYDQKNKTTRQMTVLQDL